MMMMMGFFFITFIENSLLNAFQIAIKLHEIYFGYQWLHGLSAILAFFYCNMVYEGWNVG